MPQSIEPKTPPGRRVLGFALRAVLLLIGVYGVYALLFGPEPESTISPGQLRQVVNEYRQKRRERMIGEVRDIRELMVEMRAIRDRWRREVGLAADFDAVLTEDEQQARALSAAALEPLPFHQVYDAARAAEQEMVTLYREFLTARLMGLGRGLTYAEAYEHSHTPRPNRPELDVDALYREITTTAEGGGLQAFRDQIQRSIVEVREMHENAKKLLAFTRKSNQMANDGISVDLSADDMAMLDYTGPELLPDEMDFTYAPDVGNFDAMPGRRLVSGGRMEDWLYVDTWYIIGPFPGDRRRENLDVRFGPEANVNLDDVFTGKDDEKIRWRYKKVGWAGSGPNKRAYWKIEPHHVESYAIYYAFTEIYSHAPQQVWIATATDDYGKLWINDDLVWKSPKTRKPYNATENIQLVDLKQGQNKILYRVENAGGTMGFSLMIRQKTQ